MNDSGFLVLRNLAVRTNPSDRIYERILSKIYPPQRFSSYNTCPDSFYGVNWQTRLITDVSITYLCIQITY